MIANTAAKSETETIFTTPEEGRALLDYQAQKLLGISGQEFLDRWDAGEYDELADAPGYRHIGRLATFIPFGRQNG